MHRSEPWWVLAEVCKVLEIANPSDVAKRADPIGRIQSTTIIKLTIPHYQSLAASLPARSAE